MSGTQACFRYFLVPGHETQLSSFVAKFCLIPGRRILNQGVNLDAVAL